MINCLSEPEKFTHEPKLALIIEEGKVDRRSIVLHHDNPIADLEGKTVLALVLNADKQKKPEKLFKE